MAQLTSPDGRTKFIIKHRAICEDDKFKGDWRDDVESAKIDAINHRKESGNRDHVIVIVTQQTLTVDFPQETEDS
ncbi:hypothetical protein [Haliscomenobacter hydrossis]|uniref:Uncharacterized protein n=1 Tax=Haliscomenobacter hydrossis (strain ATCC 27775 / DSM 1100 / LMG 10767 / O) TaxID=760192 RepID=F4L1D8_HALH1|nr:hypothetical protein [Haliscomenobacter hydrossis]AEE53835.1 hypothetical protein Halhy_6012 [Haliscomenobacter hydrossis DSM 1100]